MLNTPRVLAGWILAVMAVVTVRADEQPAVDYLKDVKPLLRERCFACHGALRQEGELRLDASDLIRQGGGSGPVVVAGKSADSLLLQRVGSADADERMPPADAGTPLDARQVALLKSWIDGGAKAPSEDIPADPRTHWAFQPPQSVEVPQSSAAWAVQEIDHFIAAQHKKLGIQAAPVAPPEVLLRRVYLDLIGLPPTVEQLRAFLNDSSPEAYEAVVDSLLASPEYGQRWARHWMDVWRYSDPSGYGDEIRDGREHIWRWRDWIIDSLNADKGYDQMVREMLAADELAADELTTDGQDTNELVADELAAGGQDVQRATGFLARNWYKFNRNVWLDNIVEHSSKAFLGLTLNCARCHDHKYDPIDQQEYYRMRAVFETHDVRDDPLPGQPAGLLVRAYDAHLDRPTYLFQQGDENRPLENEPLQPAVPAILGGGLAIEPVALPVTAWYPALRPENREAAVSGLQSLRDAAEQSLAEAQRKVELARQALASVPPENAETAGKDPEAKPPSTPASAHGEKQPAVTAKVLLNDDFATLSPDRWTIAGGTWTAAEGRLRQQQGDSNQSRLISRTEHPGDFRAKLRLKITGGELYRSVGIGFDVHDQQMNAVYLSAYGGGSKIQVTLQDAAGRWVYPGEGQVSLPIRIGQEYLLEVAVRGSLMNVSLDGVLQLSYRLPANRSAGQLALWTFSATAEFDEFMLEELPADVVLAGSPAAAIAKPTAASSETSVQLAEQTAEVARLHLVACESELAALRARIAAERVKYELQPGDQPQLAVEAAKAERRAAVERLEEQLARSRQQLAEAQTKQQAGAASTAAATETATATAAAMAAVERASKQIEAQTKQLADAHQRLETAAADYSPLGPQYPRTSSGRRLALARWITDRQNPLAARVAVNQIWMRHFDEPLVERVFDFGIQSVRPPKADLLDWLAVRFMDDGWSMKTLHKRIVTSGVYRLSSTLTSSDSGRALDPDNHALWRMNPRRMEAEVVRDSLLHVGGSLDASLGGPPLDHNQGQQSPRRSVYFRQDKERQMTFLSLFDGAKVNECYRRKTTVAPQQALAMFNSPLAWKQAERLAARWSELDEQAYVQTLFEHLLGRIPTAVERDECRGFLAELDSPARARQQLALVLLNHHDFVTIR